MSEVKIHQFWIWLSVLISVLVAAASGAGIFVKSVYGQETASYAAQGVGQDIVNIIVAVPVLLISAYFLRKNSVRGLMVWLGALIYIVYSYVMYAFSVHFGFLFPIYIAVLGLSFYTLFGSLASLKVPNLAASFASNTKAKTVSVFLMIFGLAFFGLWSSDILRSLLSGTVPQSVTDTGLPVNLVHVLDLAFILPGMIITSILLWKRKPAGYLFAVPLLMFAAIMGMAIIAMLVVMGQKGMPGNLPFGVAVGIMVAVSLLLIGLFLKDIKRA
jgi:hypothetical protein